LKRIGDDLDRRFQGLDPLLAITGMRAFARNGRSDTVVAKAPPFHARKTPHAR
jgi:hypothetical protein